MKKKLLKLQQTRTAKAEKLQELLAITEESGETQSRDWTEEEDKQATDLMAEIKEIDSQIKSLEKKIEADGLLAVEVTRSIVDSPEPESKKISKRYSLVKAIRAKMNNEPLEGLEREMHDEAVAEANRSGQSVTSLGVPSFLIGVDERRDLTVGTPASAGNLIQTEYGDFIPALRVRLGVRDLGAQVLTGLVGNMEFPKQTKTATAQWAGEQDTVPETTPEVDKFLFSPKRLGAHTNLSSQLLMQSSIDAETFARNELSRAVAEKLDYTALNGSGATNVPLGVLNFANVNTIALGVNGGAPTRDALLQMVSEIAAKDADLGTMAFLTTPRVRYKLQTTKTDAGSGLFVWDHRMLENLLGYRAVVSNNVPSDLTKGTGVDLNAAIFGVWNQLMIGQWAGADIIVNPYTHAKEATVEIVVNSFWDINTRHDESFSVIKDIDVS